MKRSALFAAVAMVVAAPFTSTAAKADTWGCEVLLCLSNPAGPMAVAQCVPPIKRLYRAIFKWKPDPFPTCAMAQGPNGRSWANVESNNYYDSCPAGTTPLSRGAWAVTGTADDVKKGNERRWFGINVNPELAAKPMSLGIGEGGYADIRSEDNYSPARKVCVGHHMGNTVITRSDGGTDSTQSFDVGVYDRIVHLDPYVNGFAIKVFVDSQLYRVVRPQF
jgi:hypothetical protein